MHTTTTTDVFVTALGLPLPLLITNLYFYRIICLKSKLSGGITSSSNYRESESDRTYIIKAGLLIFPPTLLSALSGQIKDAGCTLIYCY